MKGVVFEKVGAEPKLVDDLEKPSPGPGQVLVKSLWTAINPVDAFMADYGLLVLDWPLGLGVDASGVVVEADSEAQSKYGLKPGSYVCGCTRLGSKGYSAGQEYFLMDAAVTIPKPSNIDIIQAATLGVGIETAALGVFDGLQIEHPDPNNLPAQKDEWIVILGGASSVGKFAIQLAQAAGYKVIASASSRSADLVKQLGAETFDYKAPVEQQVEAVIKVAGENVSRIFDAAAAENLGVAHELFKRSTSKTKIFTTTNDWSGITDFEGGKTHLIALGPIGRPDATDLNALLSKYIPTFVGLVENGKVKTPDYHIVGQGGIEDTIEAYKVQKSGKAGSKKVVVKIQDE